MSAVPASDSPMLRTLPDGTSIEIMLHGDENFHYATLLDGSIVKEGDDGIYTMPKSQPTALSQRRIRSATTSRSSAL